MPTDPISVQLLYVNPLLGEGLERLLAAEPGLVVTARQFACGAAPSTLVDPDADVVIFEEGGPLGLEELLEQIQSPVVIVMSLHTTKVWTLRRDDLRSLPGNVVETIVATCLDRPGVVARSVDRRELQVAGELAR